MKRRYPEEVYYPYPIEYEEDQPYEEKKLMPELGIKRPYVRSEIKPKITKYKDPLWYWSRMYRDINTLVYLNRLEPGLFSRVVTVTSTPAIILREPVSRAYILLNPSRTVGLTTSGTILSSALRAAGASGNTQASSLGVGNYRTMRLFLNISATGGGVVVVNTQSEDPVSSNYATTQNDIFGSQSAVGTYYADIGELGVDTDFAISWSVSAAGTSTFSVGYVLKDGVGGSGAGLSQAIYLGGSNSVRVGNGSPIPEGQERSFFLRANTELWAVSEVSVNVQVFELGYLDSESEED